MDKCISIKLPTGIVRAERSDRSDYKVTKEDKGKLVTYIRGNKYLITESEYPGWVDLNSDYSRERFEIYMQYGDEFPV